MTEKLSPISVGVFLLQQMIPHSNFLKIKSKKTLTMIMITIIIYYEANN